MEPVFRNSLPTPPPKIFTTKIDSVIEFKSDSRWEMLLHCSPKVSNIDLNSKDGSDSESPTTLFNKTFKCPHAEW